MRFVLVLVVVLDNGFFLELCQNPSVLSELHPATTGLEVLSGVPSLHRHCKTYRYTRSELKMHWFIGRIDKPGQGFVTSLPIRIS
jgi:hypothetical protein